MGITKKKVWRSSHNRHFIGEKNMFVTITECGGLQRVWSYSPQTDDIDEAIARTIKKHFGKNAGFFRDNGLLNEGRYGQITEPAPKINAQNCLTGCVRIDTSRD
jgi:hypothetical protein